MNDIQKIAIRAPKTLSEQVATFAAIKFLYESLDAPMIDIILIKDKPHAYNYCPYIDSLHFIEEDKDTVLGVFPWIHNNSNLFGVKAFIDYHGGAAAATMGIALKAAIRIAFATTMTKPMLTHGLNKEEQSTFLDQQFLALANLVVESEVPLKIKAPAIEVSEKESVQLAALENYIFVAIRASEWSRHEKIWKYWFDELTSTNFVVVIEADIECEALKKELADRKGPQFFVIENSHYKTDMLFMSAAVGVVSDSSLYANIAQFYGMKSVILAFDLADYPSLATVEHRAEIFIERDEIITKWINKSGESIVTDMQSSVDGLNKIFSL
tara:strand:+ start:10760 stop:11737 length:978 start_codon:yes stop_codon:yes gene_type:complete